MDHGQVCACTETVMRMLIITLTLSLSDSALVVTGASEGIGRGYALEVHDKHHTKNQK